MLKLRNIFKDLIIQPLKDIIIFFRFSCFYPEGIMNMSAAIRFSVSEGPISFETFKYLLQVMNHIIFLLYVR